MSDFKLGLCIFHDLAAFSQLDSVEIELPLFPPQFITKTVQNDREDIRRKTTPMCVSLSC